MASKSANINVNINSNFQQTAKSSEDMRKRIRELRKEFYSLEEGTEEYNKVLAQLSKLQLDYSDQTIVMRNSANDLGQRLTNLVKVSGDLMSGFSAVQGVMGLLGVESDGFERTLIRLQSAMAIVQGLEGLEGMIDHMKALRASFSGITKPIGAFITAIRNWVKTGSASVATTRAQSAANATLASTTATATAATTALSGAMAILRTALVSTGIGALVVAIGTAIGALTNWISKNRENKQSLDEMNQSIEESKNATQGWTQRYEEALVERQKLEGTYDPVKVIEDQIKEQERLQLEAYNRYYNARSKYIKRRTKRNKADADAELAEYKKYGAAIEALQVELDNEKLKRQQEADKKSLEKEKQYLNDLKSQFEQLFGEVTRENPIITVNELINSYNEDLVTITKSINKGIVTESKASTAFAETQWHYSMAMIKSVMQMANLIGLKGPMGISLTQFYDSWNKVTEQIASFSSVANNPELFDYLIGQMNTAAGLAERMSTSIEKVVAPDLSDVKAENKSFSFVDYILGTPTMDNSTKRFNDRMKSARQKQMEENREAHEEEIKELEDLTNRRIALLQQYASLYSESVASLFSENEYFDTWMNDMNNAFSGMSTTLGDISSQFANFFNEETGEIDFSTMKWEDWAATAVMGLNGVSDILGSYASSYKDQMEQILESDEATDEQKQEAVKKYKNMMYAQTAIDMLSGMTAAVATAMELGGIAGPIIGAINAAMVLASGIASLTQIKAIDPMSENNVSGTNPVGGTPNVSDVAINTDAYANQLTAQSSYDLQGALDERTSPDTRVYVLESDISETSNDVNTKVSESTF